MHKEAVVFSVILFCSTASAGGWGEKTESRWVAGKEVYKDYNKASEGGWAEVPVLTGWEKTPNGWIKEEKSWKSTIEADVHKGVLNNDWGFSQTEKRAQGELNKKVNNAIN